MTVGHSSWFDYSVNLGASSSLCRRSRYRASRLTTFLKSLRTIVFRLLPRRRIHQRVCARPYGWCSSFVLLQLRRLLRSGRGPATLRDCLVRFRSLDTYHRPLHPEPVGGEDAVPYGDHPVCSLFHLGKRLDGLYRSEGRVPPGANSPIELQVSWTHSLGKDLAVSGPLLRSVHIASGVHVGHGSCLLVPPLVGCPDALVSGRLADSCVISGGSLLSEG